MTFPLRCGRLGQHDPHSWTGQTTGRLYECNGFVLTEGQLRDWRATP